jgi:hypothetical protein
MLIIRHLSGDQPRHLVVAIFSLSGRLEIDGRNELGLDIQYSFQWCSFHQCSWT